MESEIELPSEEDLAVNKVQNSAAKPRAAEYSGQEIRALEDEIKQLKIKSS